MFKFKIDKEAIKELNDILKKNNLSEIEIKNGNRSIRIAKNSSKIEYVKNESLKIKDSSEKNTNKKNKEEKEYNSENCIKAPMLGTIYHASSPKAKPFIKEGSKIKEGDIIFIIEAMKTMNQVKSDRAGVVKKILVENGMPVEFDQDLLIIE